MLIRNLTDLAEHLWCDPDEKNIARTLYKNTECGIVFNTTPQGVAVAGYAEGVDSECASHKLRFPFDSTDFDMAVKVADEDGCALWNEAHEEA